MQAWMVVGGFGMGGSSSSRASLYLSRGIFLAWRWGEKRSMGWGMQASTGMMYQRLRGTILRLRSGLAVGGDEVDVALGVDGASVADGVGGAGFVGAGAEGVGTLDLDAEQMHRGLRTVVEDEVVALAVSPGLADGEAALAGFVEEGGFGTLSDALGVGKVRVVGAGAVLRHRDTPGYRGPRLALRL